MPSTGPLREEKSEKPPRRERCRTDGFRRARRTLLAHVPGPGLRGAGSRWGENSDPSQSQWSRKSKVSAREASKPGHSPQTIPRLGGLLMVSGFSLVPHIGELTVSSKHPPGWEGRAPHPPGWQGREKRTRGLSFSLVHWAGIFQQHGRWRILKDLSLVFVWNSFHNLVTFMGPHALIDRFHWA